MTELSPADIQALLAPYTAVPVSLPVCEQIARYLDVFSVWSRRMNLSTIRDPREVVRRHFGEGFTLAEALPSFSTALDLGSGAGFPGFPIALARPGTRVTLAESQGKKAAFLREAAEAMILPVRVWPARAETLPPGASFDVVALRAVDDMGAALQLATNLLRPGGTLAFFAGEAHQVPFPPGRWQQVRQLPVHASAGTLVLAELCNTES